MISLFLLPLVWATSKTEACKSDPNSEDCTQYNILSLTQAGQYGYMTARFISYLEQKSYYIAKEYECQTSEKAEQHHRIAMTEIFDLIAGTDTGAIIAGSIAVRN